jgi:glucan phosphoethanolaminetransferase (alkaline phosphatase superfamily)
MITEKDKAFLRYWEENRDFENSFKRKLYGGLPMAILFGLPIILLIVVIRIFLPDWYMKISSTSSGMFFTAVVAMIVVVLFYAYFRMQYKWEMNEQLYQELKSKESKSINKTNIH